MHRLQVTEQRGPFIPGRLVRKGNHIISLQSTDGHKFDILEQIQLGEKRLNSISNFPETLLAPVNQVHLVHRKNYMRNTQRSGNITMSPGLLYHPITRIHQHDGQVSRAGTRNHVTRVFHMTRRISHDEFSLGCGHEAVGNINRNTLLTLSA